MKLLKKYAIFVLIDFLSEFLFIAFGLLPIIFSLILLNGENFYRFSNSTIIFLAFIAAYKNGLLFNEEKRLSYNEFYNKKINMLNSMSLVSVSLGTGTFFWLYFKTSFYSF